MHSSFDYLVIGAGPAGIAAVAKLYGLGIRRIAWLDPEFKVGAFGTILSAGSGVPGNTTVQSYRQVITGIHAAIPSIPVKPHALDHLAQDDACHLNVAREPFQYLSDALMALVTTLQGRALYVNHQPDGIEVIYSTDETTQQRITTQRVILAIGATPKSLPLPDSITEIDPHTAFIASSVKTYIADHPTIKKVAIIGSSHSAALACMQFLNVGIRVKQFMNKPYRFATPVTLANGETHIQFDNTGLKAKVARYTQALLANPNPLWECTRTPFSASELRDVTHAVFCIGYEVKNPLLINGRPLSTYQHDASHSQLYAGDKNYLPGIFGIGIAFPKQVMSPFGEWEFAVGIRKFWASLDEVVLKQWHEFPIHHDKLN